MDTNILSDYRPDQSYSCSPDVRCAGFTPLMYLIINANKLPDKNILIDYIVNHSTEINEQNKKGWTALHLVARNSRKLNIKYLIPILIKDGADVNKQDNDGRTALMFASRNSNTESSLETVK